MVKKVTKIVYYNINLQYNSAEYYLGILNYMWKIKDFMFQKTIYFSTTWKWIKIMLAGLMQLTRNSVPKLHANQQCIPEILRQPIVPVGFEPTSPSFIVWEVTEKLSCPRLTSARTEMFTISGSLSSRQSSLD